MKIPLSYQYSEYDCVPITFLNALRYLCEREEIDPIVIKTIYRQSLDSCDTHGDIGKRGTSEQAVKSLAEWINSYSEQVGLGIDCAYLSRGEITLENLQIAETVKNGGAFMSCIHFAGSYHYVLVTGFDNGYVYLFDPYYMDVSPDEDDFALVVGHAAAMNRRVRQEFFFASESRPYALGAIAKREGVLIRRCLAAP